MFITFGRRRGKPVGGSLSYLLFRVESARHLSCYSSLLENKKRGRDDEGSLYEQIDEHTLST